MAHLTMKTIKVVRTSRNMNEKKLCSMMPKTTRKKLCQGTKANHCRQIRRRVLKIKVKMTTEPVTSKTTPTATAMVEVIVLLAPEGDPWNG